MSTESTLWMGDIETWMNEEIIMKSFTECGIKPISVKTIKDKKLNLLRNYCFINFDNMIEANKALIQLNGKKLPNANFIFKLNWANQNSEGNKNLYVGNLAPEIDDIELYNLFKSKYPSVHHASIITDKGISKGFGFVHFSTKEDYDNCLKEMDGFIFHNYSIKVKERKKKKENNNNSEEKNNNKIKIDLKNNLYKNNLNNTKINLYKKKKNNKKDNKEFNKNENYINNFYYKNNNDNYYINNSKHFNMNQININNIVSFYPKRKGEEDNYRTDNEETTFSSLEKDQDVLSSSNSNSSVHKNRKFSDNIELLESNNQKVLNQKIQESVDKMFEHYKYNNRNSESKSFLYLFKFTFLIFIVSKMIVYYCSNACPFSDPF